MNRPNIALIDIESGEVITREMNDEEFAVYQADQAADAIRKAEAEAKATAKAALLEQLGITEEQARLLLS